MHVPYFYFSFNLHDPYVNVWTDGACPRNGQNGAVTGYGVFWGTIYFTQPVGSKLANVCAPLLDQPQTNNRAEIHAVIEALYQARDEGHKRVRNHTDSIYASSIATDWSYKWLANAGPDGRMRKANGRPPANLDLVEELHRLLNDGHFERVIFKQVRAHSNNYGNDMADRLARQGARYNYPERGNEIVIDY